LTLPILVAGHVYANVRQLPVSTLNLAHTAASKKEPDLLSEAGLPGDLVSPGSVLAEQDLNL
jgi:hypothetical protein